MRIPKSQYIKNFRTSCALCVPEDFRIVNLRNGKPYTGKIVTVDPKTKDIVIDTRRPFNLLRLGIEAYYGTEKETQCHFMKPMRYGMMFTVCGSEILRVRDRSPMNINVTIGEGKDLALDLKSIMRNYQVSNPMCSIRLFLKPNLTISDEEYERKPDRFSSFLKLDKEKGKLFVNHTNNQFNCSYITGNRRCEGMGQNITKTMWLKAVTLGNKTVTRRITFNFNE